MAPPKKYITGKFDVHANIEAELKAIGDFFGLVPTTLLTEAYKATINENISRFGAPEEIKDRWDKFSTNSVKESSDALKRERELKRVGIKSGLQKKAVDDEKNRFVSWIYTELLPHFTPDEINHFILAVKDSQEFKVRYAITSIIKRYNERAGCSITLSKEDEIVLINHLVDFGGM